MSQEQVRPSGDNNFLIVAGKDRLPAAIAIANAGLRELPNPTQLSADGSPLQQEEGVRVEWVKKDGLEDWQAQAAVNDGMTALEKARQQHQHGQ